NSQQWLKSREPERFDDAALDSVRRGARQKIAELQGGRFRSLGMFRPLNWKPLIIACPIFLLMCWSAAHWILDTRRDSSGPGSVARIDGDMQKEDENRTDARPDNAVGVRAKDPGERPHRRRSARRIRPAHSSDLRDQDSLQARGETYQVPPLRIEIQTED